MRQIATLVAGFLLFYRGKATRREIPGKAVRASFDWDFHSALDSPGSISYLYARYILLVKYFFTFVALRSSESYLITGALINSANSIRKTFAARILAVMSQGCGELFLCLGTKNGKINYSRSRILTRVEIVPVRMNDDSTTTGGIRGYYM